MFRWMWSQVSPCCSDVKFGVGWLVLSCWPICGGWGVCDRDCRVCLRPGVWAALRVRRRPVWGRLWHRSGGRRARRGWASGGRELWLKSFCWATIISQEFSGNLRDSSYLLEIVRDVRHWRDSQRFLEIRKYFWIGWVSLILHCCSTWISYAHFILTLV